jgi:hypothetical protein
MKINVQILLLLLTVSFVWLAQPALAQTASQRPTGGAKTESRILYHDGPVMVGSSNVYLIWYGCWDNNCGLVGDVGTQSNRVGLCSERWFITVFPDPCGLPKCVWSGA